MLYSGCQLDLQANNVLAAARSLACCEQFVQVGKVLAAFGANVMYSVSQQNTLNIFSSNSSKLYPTFTIFGTNITERLNNQKLVYLT